MFGKCIVQRTHELDGTHFKRHGYWPRTGEDFQPLACSDAGEIQTIKEDFDLKRGDESGTSWIIPYVDVKTFNKENLINEVLRDFFFSIMAGALTVDVMGVTINQSNIAEIIAEYPVTDLPIEFVHFLEEALALPENDASFIQFEKNWYGSGAESPLFEDAVESADLERARAALDQSGLIAVKLTVPIKRIGQDEEMSEISVFLKRPDHLSRTEEIYVRNGLIISEEQHLRNAPGRYYGLVQASDPLISEFLGFAEVASHMKWNNRESEVTGRYEQVKSTIAHVRHSLPKLAKLLLGHTSSRQDDALIDFLSIPVTETKNTKSTRKKKRVKPVDIVDTPTKTSSRFQIDQTGTRWILKPGPGAKDIDYPVRVRIDLAYATMPGEGDPFKVYHHFEFDLADETAHPISIENGSVTSRDLNRLEVELNEPDFNLAIDGFSEHALKSSVRGLTQ